MEQPEHFAGIVTIYWAPKTRKDNAPLPGWYCAVTLDGKVLPGVTAFDVHASAIGPVWAEVTTLIAEDGSPVKTAAQCHLGEDGEPVVATFAYIVAGMDLGLSQAELKRFERKMRAR